MDTIYEHLGNPISDKTYKITSPSDHDLFNKPCGGLWGSRISNIDEEDYISWRDWIKIEDFYQDLYLDEDNQYKFKLKENAKIFTIDGRNTNPPEKLLSYFWIDKYNLQNRKSGCEEVINKIIPDKSAIKNIEKGMLILDWEYITNNYDGCELIHGNWYYPLRYGGFIAWDCDSIVVWNHDVVETLDH